MAQQFLQLIKKNIIIIKKMIEHQISILECFLKYNATLKTRVKAAENSAITGLNVILKYITIESYYFKL